MPGTAIENFADFVKSTGPQFFRSANDLLNEAVLRSYSLQYFVRGKEMSRVIQGGDQIKDEVMFDEAGSTRTRYKPNREFTWSQPQVLTEQTADWRFTSDHMSWTDHEIELNIDERLPDQYVEVQYKNLRRKIEKRMWTSLINGDEKDLWRAPVAAEMEASSGDQAFSIPAFITEDTTNFHPIGWTTIMGIDPATETRWRNQVATYDAANPFTAGASLLEGLDDLWVMTRFQPPPIHKEHFEPGTDATANQVIFASRNGCNQYRQALRQENDRTAEPSDAGYTKISFSGIPIVYIDLMDGSRTDGLGAIFNHQNSGDPYDEDGKDASGAAEGSARTGARYIFVNGNYITMIFHQNRYFFMVPPYRMPKQPFTWVAPTDCWNNLFCNSRQRNGILAPSG
jgi:hypothetical protein